MKGLNETHTGIQYIGLDNCNIGGALFHYHTSLLRLFVPSDFDKTVYLYTVQVIPAR